ncbi:hypothetical protein, partial [Tannerella forsythia]|uniref:hypothetical protein n=1 Tax=Tannerella forsythia TaxID=28112 RepID=UPI0036F19CBF
PPRRRAESLNEYGFRCPLCHSERGEESRGEEEKILRFALNDKLMVNGQWSMVNGYAWYTPNHVPEK